MIILRFIIERIWLLLEASRINHKRRPDLYYNFSVHRCLLSLLSLPCLPCLTTQTKIRTHWQTWTFSAISSLPVRVPNFSSIFTIVSQKDTPAATATQSKAVSTTKDLKDLVISSLYHKKMQLESVSKKELAFALTRDHLICVFITIMTILTAVFFVASPSNWFPKWYTVAVITMLVCRIVDYTQKKEHFFLIDFCYTAGIQIIFFLTCRPHSVHLATRSFGFGAGILGWSTVLLSNGLTINRLDEFCSLWIHSFPSLLAYTLRWTNENSVIYYKTAPFSFSGEHMAQYYLACYAPYVLWAVGYYFLINKAFKHLTVEGDYMTLVKYIGQSSPKMTTLLDIFGPKYRVEAFIMYHALFFSVMTAVGYACFFFQPLHTVCLGFCIGFAIVNGAKTLVADIARPYRTSLERINLMLTTLG